MTPQFMSGTDPRHTLRRCSWLCLIISVKVDHAHELRGEKVHEKFPHSDADGKPLYPKGLPDDHDGWEHEVFWPLKQAKPEDKLEYEFIGRFTNFGEATEAARRRFESEQSN